MAGFEVVRVPGWERFEWLRVGFSTRGGGESQVYGSDELNLGLTREDDPQVVRQNRARLVAAVAGGSELVVGRQVHGVEVRVVSSAADGGRDGDGLITATPGVLVAALAADCVPVLVADTRRRVVGAFHAGWRGTAAGIAGVGIARMSAEFGCRPADLVAAVGPSIGPCCYQVGEELREYFEPSLFRGDSLDLWEANRRQLQGAGVPSVSVVGECTACLRVEGARKYFSHRADAGRTGRGMGVIGVG